MAAGNVSPQRAGLIVLSSTVLALVLATKTLRIVDLSQSVQQFGEDSLLLDQNCLDFQSQQGTRFLLLDRSTAVSLLLKAKTELHLLVRRSFRQSRLFTAFDLGLLGVRKPAVGPVLVLVALAVLLYELAYVHSPIDKLFLRQQLLENLSLLLHLLTEQISSLDYLLWVHLGAIQEGEHRQSEEDLESIVPGFLDRVETQVQDLQAVEVVQIENFLDAFNQVACEEKFSERVDVSDAVQLGNVIFRDVEDHEPGEMVEPLEDVYFVGGKVESNEVQTVQVLDILDDVIAQVELLKVHVLFKACYVLDLVVVQVEDAQVAVSGQVGDFLNQVVREVDLVQAEGHFLEVQESVQGVVGDVQVSEVLER